MARRSSRLLLLVAVLSLGLIHAQNAHAGQRVVGFGFNVAGGAWGAAAWADGSSAGIPPMLPYLELGSPELRIHPAEIFSIDLQWNAMWMVIFATWGAPSYLQSLYATFHLTPRLPLSLTLAPMAKIWAYDGGAMPGVGARLGLEFNSPKRRFCLGLALRPSTWIITDGSAGVAIPEIVLETTFIWYSVKD